MSLALCDTLTFTARLSDVLSLASHCDCVPRRTFHLGPLQLDFSKVAEVGIAGVDLRRCVLPACVCSPCSSEDSRWKVLPSSCRCITCAVVSAQKVRLLDSLLGT